MNTKTVPSCRVVAVSYCTVLGFLALHPYTPHHLCFCCFCSDPCTSIVWLSLAAQTPRVAAPSNALFLPNEHLTWADEPRLRRTTYKPTRSQTCSPPAKAARYPTNTTSYTIPHPLAHYKHLLRVYFPPSPSSARPRAHRTRRNLSDPKQWPQKS